MKMDHRHYGTERRLSAVASHREGNTRGREYAPCETITEMPPWETKKEACVWQRLPLGSAGRTSGRTSGRTVSLQAAAFPPSVCTSACVPTVSRFLYAGGGTPLHLPRKGFREDLQCTPWTRGGRRVFATLCGSVVQNMAIPRGGHLFWGNGVPRTCTRRELQISEISEWPTCFSVSCWWGWRSCP